MTGSLSTKSSEGNSIERVQQSPTGRAGQCAVIGPYGGLLSLQQSAGNRAVSDLMGSTVSYSPSTGTVLQRQCASCVPSGGECTEYGNRPEGMLERSPSPAKGEGLGESEESVPPLVHEVLHSQGQPLDPTTSDFMESRFRHNFSEIRVHSDARASESARSVNALAYTVGHNIVFRAGQYMPHTDDGRHLIAHELTHVVQQGGQNQRSSALTIEPSRHAAEAEARAVADAIVHQSHPPVSVAQAGGCAMSPVMQRYEAGEHAQFGETGDVLKGLVAARAFTYKVKSGETLPKIATKFRITVEELKEANRAKLKNWPSAAGRGKRIEGFNAGEEILIPPVLNEATNEALKAKELTLVVNGAKLEYGEGIAMGDLFENPEQMMSTPKDKLEGLSKLIQKEKAGIPVSTSEWEHATDGRYLKLAEKNEAHFAPPNPALVAASGKSTVNHNTAWEKHHEAALRESQGGNKDKALATNAFGDHFLTDAFAGGHLINKRDVMDVFKGNLPLDIKGEFTAGAKAFFDAVAKKSFTGSVKKEFSAYETVEYLGAGIFRPNIDSESRFSELLQGIHKKEPDLLANAVAKAVHDALNKQPAGVPVENATGDKWDLSGDGTLNPKSREISRKAVAQSQLNVLDAFKMVGPLNLPELFKKVWDFVPRPTSAGEKVIKTEVAGGTDPKSAKLIDAVVNLITTNYMIILDQLVKRGVLKKA